MKSSSIASALVATREDAIEERNDLGSEEPVRRRVIVAATEKLQRRVGVEVGGGDAFDLIAICFVEDLRPDLDGIWWEDEPGPMSAPRGCILPTRAWRWSPRVIDRIDALA
jgi:hypothetical protein